MAQQAQDTFTASPDGVPVVVQKGQVFRDDHPLVKLDAGRGLLFRPIDETPEPPAKESRRGRPPGKGAG